MGQLYIRRCLATFAAATFLSVSLPAHAQEKTIRFAYQSNLFMAPIFAAFEKGWFEEALAPLGYRMEAHKIGVGPAIAEAMAGGKIDIGELGLAVVVNAAGRGLPIKILANNGIAGEGVIVRADSEAKSMADLRGKSIAIPAKGSLPDFIVRYGLEKAGIDPSKDVKFVEVSGPDQKQALLGGLVDAAVVWEPVVTDITMNGGRLLATGQEIYPNHVNDVIAATDAAIEQHPDAVRAVTQTVVRSHGWVLDNPDEAISIAAKYLGLQREVVEKAWPNVIRSRDGVTSTEDTQVFADALKRWGYIRSRVDATQLIDPQFLPASK